MNLKRLFASIALVPLLLHFRVDGQSTHSLLWKISRKNQDSYIFINTTNTCESKITIGGKLATALSNARLIVFETAATNRANEKAFLMAAQNMTDDGYTAKNMLSPFVYRALQDKAADIGLNELFFERYNLFFVKVKLETAAITCDLSKIVRLEDVLRDTAKKTGIPVTELLTINEFFDLYRHYPKSFWDKSITFLLDHPDHVTDAINSKAAAYKAEDLAALKKIVGKDEYYGIRYSFQDQESARCTLLTTRIEKLIAKAPALIILDASEIASDQTSVFKALAAAGYTLTPL